LKQDRTFAEVQTQIFTVMVVAQWFNALNCRSATQSVFKIESSEQQVVNRGADLAGNLLQAFVIYAPFMNRIFHTTQIPLKEALTIGLVGSSVLWVEEIRKFFVSP
jgi:magnesium-transporting ATPase (P-type)